MTPAARKILRDLAKHAKCFDLTDGGLGDDLLKIATDGVLATIAAQQTPDGVDWDELSPGYAKWKAKHYPGKPIGEREGLMSAADEVAGIPEVTPGEAVVTYGTSEKARAEASYFQEGDPSRGWPPRPFWGLTDRAIEEVQRILDRRFDGSTR
jgi:hypothetical protein